MTLSARIALALLVVVCSSCDRKRGSTSKVDSSPAREEPSPTAQQAQNQIAAQSLDGHGGLTIELGSTVIGDYQVRAARDAGELKPGGDAPVDVWLTGNLQQVAAVRFWIGGQDARGSVKARADIEDPKNPNHWHTHVEIPNPIPDEARIWVEIETTNGQKSSGSFDLGR